jgi:hypothetical protein
VTDLVDELHAQAGLNLLRANGEILVYDGQVPKAPAPGVGPVLPFVLVYVTIKWPADGTANTLDAQAVTVNVEFNCHCVGETAAAARAMQMQVRARLLNQRPVVTGRNCGLIQQDDVQAPAKDEASGRLVMDGVSIYSFISAPG